MRGIRTRWPRSGPRCLSGRSGPGACRRTTRCWSCLPAGQPGLLFLRVPEGETAKNRIHFDLWPTSTKRDEQIERAIGLGAVVLDDRRRADGTGWVVFADPDGNEFCIGRSAAERAANSSPLEDQREQRVRRLMVTGISRSSASTSSLYSEPMSVST